MKQYTLDLPAGSILSLMTLAECVSWNHLRSTQLRYARRAESGDADAAIEAEYYLRLLLEYQQDILNRNKNAR